MSDQAQNHHRRSIRLRGYDYSQAGAYFVNLCTQGRATLFGDIVGGAMHLNAAGEQVQAAWENLPCRFPGLLLDAMVVMPNHLHGILVLTGENSPIAGRGEPCVRPEPGGYYRGEHEVRPYSEVRPNELVDDIERQMRTNACPGGVHGTLPGTVGRIIQAFKSLTTNAYIHGVRELGWQPFAGRLWQRDYWEHIIRNDRELWAIQEYIANNPAQWASDRDNLAR